MKRTTLVLVTTALTAVQVQAQGYRGWQGNGGFNGPGGYGPGAGIMGGGMRGQGAMIGGGPTGVGMIGGPGMSGQPPGFPDHGSFLGMTGGYGMQGSGVPGVGWSGGIMGGGVIGREPPFGGIHGNGPAGGFQGRGGIGGMNGPNVQPPVPPRLFPDPRGGGKDKDDRRDPAITHIPHIHIPELNSFRSETRSGIPEPHTSLRSAESFHGFGGSGKWFAGGLAGLGAAIAGIFRGKSGSKPAEKVNMHSDLGAGLPLGQNGQGGVWIRK